METLELKKVKELMIVGIEVRTSNLNGQAAKDIPALWNRFMTEQVDRKLPNKINNTIYALYTDYEGDHNAPYTTIIGYEVENLDNIPEEFTVKIVPKAEYAQFTAKGDLTKNAVIDVWMQIWNSSLDRKYTTDIEMYDHRAMNPTDGVAEILVAV